MRVAAIIKNKKILTFVTSSIMVIFLYSLWQAGADVGSLIALAFFAMIPLTLAAVGECMNEQAGLINIGLEGMLLLGAFMGAFMALFLGHWVWGLLFGMLTGAAMGFIFGFISVYCKADQIIAGLAIVLLGSGLTGFLLMEWAMLRVLVLPVEFQMPSMVIPWLGTFSPFIFVVILIAIFASYILHRTLLGVRIRAAGEKPEALDVAGVRVDLIRMFTAILGGALAGLGGAFMTVGWFGSVTIGVTGGRGFIALAIVIFAGARPLLALAGAFLFGFVDALGIWVAISPVVKGFLPPHADILIGMVPYIVPILVLFFIGAKKQPSALGKPYVRE